MLRAHLRSAGGEGMLWRLQGKHTPASVLDPRTAAQSTLGTKAQARDRPTLHP